MKVNCKLIVCEYVGEILSIIDCVHCCQEMKEMDAEYDIVCYGEKYAAFRYYRHGDYILEKITHCPWCGEKIEYVVTKRVREVKHETQKVVNEVTYTEEEIS